MWEAVTGRSRPLAQQAQPSLRGRAGRMKGLRARPFEGALPSGRTAGGNVLLPEPPFICLYTSAAHIRFLLGGNADRCNVKLNSFGRPRRYP